MTKIAAIALTALLAVAATSAAATSKKVTLKSENIASLSEHVLAAPSGRTLYRLKPETAHHLLCKTACLSFWKPLFVKSKKTKVKLPSGIKGKIGFLARGKKFQVTLKGLPLYTFTGDNAVGQANGQNIKSFGGTWMVLKVSGSSSGSPPATMTPPGYTTPGY
jgi:predicted lipoprotein with Yx(FWY)xxD motif